MIETKDVICYKYFLIYLIATIIQFTQFFVYNFKYF